MLPSSVDLLAFMGQSNMAGRGVAAQAPAVPEGHGYEFRAITAPDRLSPLVEPFGQYEDKPDGIYEPGMKSGSMVSSFVNAYYAETSTPVVGVSAAKGGSAIAEWLPEGAYYRDAIERVQCCELWLSARGVNIAHRNMVWCQGCTDGDLHTDPQVYYERTKLVLTSFMRDCDLAYCFLIRIGNHRDDPALYVPIQKMQEKLAADVPNIVLVSQCLASFAAKGLMKDEFHYLQEGYNLVGEEAGKASGAFVRTEH